MTPQQLFRAAALATALVGGSCTATIPGADSISEDGAANHPIAVDPAYRDLRVYYAGGAGGMTPDDAVKFDSFLAEYRAHGNGSLGISVPDGPASRVAISYFAERAAATGISRDKILVSTHELAGGDRRVDV